MRPLHRRTVIRCHVVELLKGATRVGNSVHKTRIVPLSEGELPSICVYTLSDSPVIENEAPMSLKHSLSLLAEVSVARTKDADDLLDEICAQIEEVVSQDRMLYGTSIPNEPEPIAMNCILGATDISPSSEGDTPILTAKITLDITYRSYWPERVTGADRLRPFAGVDSEMKAQDEEVNPEIDSTTNF